MEKKYQVFISSTYEDLKDERLGVFASLLTANCIPVGMEQFTASGLSQWEYIKKMIDMSDYYVLILAGRYGSIEQESGLGYTEKEFNYALEKGIPILPFLYKDITSLPVNKRDNDHELWKRLDQFCEKATNGRMVNFYTSTEDLKLKVAMAITNVIRDIPAMGWVRADSIPNDVSQQEEIRSLKEQVASLSSELKSMPRIITGHGEPTDLRDGDIYFKYE